MGLFKNLLCWRKRNRKGQVVSPMPNPQPGEPGWDTLVLQVGGSSGPSPSTCPARVSLPVPHATTGIALKIICPHKPSLPELAFDKVETPLEESHERAPEKSMAAVDQTTSDAVTQTDSSSEIECTPSYSVLRKISCVAVGVLLGLSATLLTGLSDTEIVIKFC